MSPELRRLLREHQLRTQTQENLHGLVFTDAKGNPLSPDAWVKVRFKPAVDRAEIGHVRLHDLRHT